MSLENKATSEGRTGGKGKHFYLTHTCSFTPIFLHYCFNLCTAAVPLLHDCVFLNSHFQAKDPFVCYSEATSLAVQRILSLKRLIHRWAKARSSMDSEKTTSIPAGCLLHALQLNLKEKGVLLARTCLKDMLLLLHSKC